MNRRRLGRGLEALLGREDGGFEASSLDSNELIQIAVDQIDPNPFQPRRYFNPEDIASLADSLRQHGMLQPILVRAAGERYQLIAGERRLRASIEAQLHEIPARILALDDQRVFELAMVENLQREDLNAIDKATAFRDYLNRYGGTQEELAGRLGLDRTTISNLIRLLELPEPVIDSVRKNVITPGHARAILGLHDAESRACDSGESHQRTSFGPTDRSSRGHRGTDTLREPASARTLRTTLTTRPPIFSTLKSNFITVWELRSLSKRGITNAGRSSSIITRARNSTA